MQQQFAMPIEQNVKLSTHSICQQLFHHISIIIFLRKIWMEKEC